MLQCCVASEHRKRIEKSHLDLFFKTNSDNLFFVSRNEHAYKSREHTLQEQDHPWKFEFMFRRAIYRFVLSRESAETNNPKKQNNNFQKLPS